MNKNPICCCLLRLVSTLVACGEPDESTLPEGTDSLPFAPGEELTLKLGWSLFSVGNITMKVSGPEKKDGTDCLHFHLSARTRGFADKLFKVRTDIHGWVDEQMSRTYHYEKNQEEGKTHREIVVDFNWPENKLQYSNWGEAIEPLKLEGAVFDPLSAIYYFRTLPIEIGGEYAFPVTDGKRLVTGRVWVRELETVKTSLGKINCYKLEPELKHIGGVFRESKGKSMYIWLSADKYRVPVKVKTKVKVGSFHATLSGFKVAGEGDGLPDDCALLTNYKEIRRNRRGR